MTVGFLRRTKRSGKKAGGKRFAIDTRLWYGTIAHVFLDWKSFVIERYRATKYQAIEAKREALYDPYEDDAVLDNLHSAVSVAAFDLYDRQSQALDREESRLNREINAWYNLPNNQRKLLRWWLKWQGLSLSHDDLERRLALHLGLWVKKGHWQTA